ncbi:alpha-galactosidase [Acetobacter pasteurianus]
MSSETPKNSSRKKTLLTSRRTICKAAGLAGGALLVSTAKASSPHEPASSLSQDTKTVASPSRSMTLPAIPARMAAGDADSAPRSMYRLDSPAATLVLIEWQEGLPEIAHWGARLPQNIHAEDVFTAREADTAQNATDQWKPLITLLDTIGDWRFDQPGLIAHRPDGTDWTANFSVKTIEEKPGHLSIHAEDTIARLKLVIELTLSEQNVLTMSSRLTNTGPEPLEVARLVSGTFLVPDRVQSIRVMHGAWTKEFEVSSMTLAQAEIVTESRRNRTHDHFPGMLAATPGANGTSGEVWSMQLGWSGSHRMSAQRLEDGRIRFCAGEWLYPGEVCLQSGESLQTPPAYAAYSNEGFSGCARAFHAHARKHVLVWPNKSMSPRPVILNSWEGNGFNLNEPHLFRQIEAAAKLGVERFVLDDGWFGSRRDDSRGLGDWNIAPDIFPRGLKPLADHAHQHDMQFGLWFEPEMVNPESELYRAHPDWVLAVRGRPLRTSRYQVVLDISRQDVCDYLFTAVSQLVSSVGIDYIKWDFNRDLVEAADAHGRAAYRRQVLALYALWDRLHAAHPTLEIESCASGGGRADWGALAHTQRIWTSDNTDALDRLRIQGGAWQFLPAEVTGTHISAVPNGITGRVFTLQFRAAVALFGHLGIELDPLELSADEREELVQWVNLHKRLRGLLHSGDAQFGEETSDRVVRGVTAQDRSAAVFLIAQSGAGKARSAAPVRLPGLDPNRRYRVIAPTPQKLTGNNPSAANRALFDKGIVVSGAVLQEMGLTLPRLYPAQAFILECQAI